MSYNAKHWTDPLNIKAKDLNELEFGVQEAHENLDILNKTLTNIEEDQAELNKRLNILASGSSDAFAIVKDIENLLKDNDSLAEVLKINSDNFLTKSPQILSSVERSQILRNLGLTNYKFLKSISINGTEVQEDTLDIVIPKVDTRLSATSNNAISNAVVTNAITNIKIPNIDSYLTDYATIDFVENKAFNTIKSEMLLRQQGDEELHELLKTHTHTDMATKTFVRNEISLIPTPDVSGQISEHNLSDTAHQDIRDAIKNIDLSGYALKDHNHDKVYAPYTHSHPYANENHTHDDYLPLTAGSEKPLTSSLYITSTNADRYIHIGPGGAIRGAANGRLILSSSGNTNHISLRPNGTGDTAYEIIASVNKFYSNVSNTHQLGDSDHLWKEIHGTTIYQNGKQVADKDHTHDYSNTYAPFTHDHDGVYAPFTHDHNYATQSNIDTAISDLKTWLLGTGNADTIDTIKDIADLIEEHGDILDALANTYALKDHNHDNVYLPLTAGSSKALTAALYANKGIYMDNNNWLYLKDSGGSYKQAIGMTAANNIIINYNNSGNTLTHGAAFAPVSAGNKAVNLGVKDSNEWNNIYGTTIYEAGTALSNKYVTIATNQTISGEKTFSKTSGFNYSGIESASSDTTRHIWFAHTDKKGTPVYNDSFKFNPSSQKATIGGITIGGANSDNHTISSSSGILRFGNGSNVNGLAVLANTGTTTFFRPAADNSMDLGNGTYRWKDLYLARALNGMVTSPATARLTSLNFAHQYISSSSTGKPLCRVDLATSACTTANGKPSGGDGYVLTCMWDNTGMYTAQLFLSNGSARPQIRTGNASGWSDWKDLAWLSDTSGALKLDGSNTMTGKLNLKATGANDTNIGDNGIRWGTNSLPQDTAPQYICTIDGFANGGRQKWASVADVATAIGLSNYVDKINNQSIAGNKTFTGTTSTMDLNCYSTLRVVNGSNNALIWNIVTDTNGNLVFKHS